MKHFYVGINNFIYKHPFIKSCVHFSSLFCPWMVAIFYSLFLLKIVIESPNGFFYLFSKPMMVLICTALLRIFINRPRPYEKYSIKPIGDKRQSGHSFPSIHASLTLSIALTVIKTGPNMGLLLEILPRRAASYPVPITNVLLANWSLKAILILRSASKQIKNIAPTIIVKCIFRSYPVERGTSTSKAI